MLSAAQLPGSTIPKDTEFRVKLLTPIDTATNRKGDKLTAQVVQPPEFAGDMMEGTIRESKGGAKVKGKASLDFTFDKLYHAGKTLNVHSSVTRMLNSHGKENVDEEGRIIEKKNNLGKAAALTGAGAIIGAIAGGGTGAAIGAGAGAAASIVLIKVTAQGVQIHFAAGSEFIMSVKER